MSSRAIVLFGKVEQILQTQQAHTTEIAHWIVALKEYIESRRYYNNSQTHFQSDPVKK